MNMKVVEVGVAAVGGCQPAAMVAWLEVTAVVVMAADMVPVLEVMVSICFFVYVLAQHDKGSMS